MYSSVYWISITFFRFALAFVDGKSSKKIEILIAIGVVQAFVSYFIIYHINAEMGLVMSAIIFGLSNSVVFPLLLIVP